jgi:Ca-activated chloride channel family protein
MFLTAVAALSLLSPLQDQAAPGQLTILQRDGKPGALCPLSGTTVTADIAGYAARVTVVQAFVNPSADTIEAVYTFPLPNDAAVDRMRMRVGKRVIEGLIKRREEARTIYEAAKAQGMSAALLDQERPNVFTQSVANITPGAKVEIEISYVQLLKFEDSQFEFSFPMVVGPRYLGNTSDPDKVAPPVTPRETRTGADIRLTVNLDAGAPIREVSSVLHAISTRKLSEGTAVITLAKRDEIPNRDFILRYRCATNTVTGALLTHASRDKGGFFSLVLLPPQSPNPEQVAPKEVIFVMDQSGSQRGFPMEKSKELTLKLIDKLNPGDTFNVLGFSNEVNWLWPQVADNTPEARANARKFVEGLQANGGTELFKAVAASLSAVSDPRRVRIVVFNTDGFVGNEFQILQGIKEYRQNSRMFTFGIGNSVNRFLIDSMSAMGKGDAEYVTLAEKADAAVNRFIQRVDKPILTHINVSFEGVSVSEALPEAIPDVFSDKPVIVKGRYKVPGKGFVVVSGLLGGKAWSEKIPIEFPAVDQNGSAIASIWAREKVESLMREDWLAQVSGANRESSTARSIEAIGLEFGIMTQFTSFVAVEQRVVNVGGKQRTVAVPVEMPEGVSYEGVFGEEKGLAKSSMRRGSGVVNLSYSGGAGGGVAAAPGATSAATKLDKGGAQEAQDKPMTEAQSKQSNFEQKVSEKLRKVKSGSVTVQVWLKTWSEADLEKLRKIGLKVEDKDRGLKVVFGSCDVAKLKELAQVESVTRIEPL